MGHAPDHGSQRECVIGQKGGTVSKWSCLAGAGAAHGWGSLAVLPLEEEPGRAGGWAIESTAAGLARTTPWSSVLSGAPLSACTRSDLYTAASPSYSDILSTANGTSRATLACQPLKSPAGPCCLTTPNAAAAAEGYCPVTSCFLMVSAGTPTSVEGRVAAMAATAVAPAPPPSVSCIGV